MRRFSILTPALTLSIALTGCGASAKDEAAVGLSRDATRLHADSVRDSTARARQDSINRTLPGYIIDSVRSPEEEMRRFQEAVGGKPATALVGGESAREYLVQKFVQALSARDTMALRSMRMTAREFIDLYYAESPWSRPPYRQSPSMAWRMMGDPSDRGLERALKRFGGIRVAFLSEKCAPSVLHEGTATRYDGCLVTIREGDGTPTTRRLYGSIVEIGGQFKFLSYSNGM